MPGKSQASNRGKQDSSKERLASAKSNSGSVKKVMIWPAWSESDSDKQEQATSGKGRERGKASQAPVLFEDPEGVVLPQSLLALGNVCWKRPTDVNVLSALGNEDVIVVKDPDCTSIDLISNNKHILHSELMSWVISEISALWCVRPSLPTDSTGEEETRPEWKPWSHIYPQAKGFLFNPQGKYTVRLYWMGSWRKVTVDDFLPFLDNSSSTEQDDDNRYTPLYPRTTNPSEIWPALLTKALLKIAALDAPGEREFGDFSVVHLLTGWVPRVITLDADSKDNIWNEFITQSLPMWRRDSEENGQQIRGSVVLASFQKRPKQTKGNSLEDATLEEDILKEAGLIPSNFDMTTSPSYPMLLTQARDEPLIAPPDTPPPPVLQAPFYLGLKHRQPNPGEPEPPSPPPPEAPWFVEVVPGLEEGSRERDEVEREGSQTEVKSKSGAVWMGYSDFVKSFSHLHIFDNPSNFKHRNTYVDLSKTIEERPPPQQPKKTASLAQIVSQLKVSPPQTETDLLFVDSPHPIHLHITFSSLSNWREGQKNTHTVPHSKAHPFPLKDESQLSMEAEHVVAGSLVVEPFVWNSVQSRAPLLRVKTTGTKGATLSLKPGRHILKLHVKSPIGYHVDLSSQCVFSLADIDTIYSHLSKESSLYVSYCSQFIETFFTASVQFGDDSGGLEASLQPLVERLTAVGLNAHHAQLLLASTIEVWSSHIKEYGLTNQMEFAWKSFFYRSFAVLEHGLPPSDTIVNLQTVRRSLSKGGLAAHTAEGSSEGSPQENQAASLIVKSLRSHVESRRRQSMIPGTSGNEQAVKEIENSLNILQPHVDRLGVEVFNCLFELEPSLKEIFPFQTDESTRCFDSHYTGAFPPMYTNSWTVVVRAVFHVPEAQMLVPQFSCPVPSCLLRVINNDTMTELPRLFHNTLPLTYKPNAHGYTVQAEAWCPSGEVEGVEGGKWSLRLVSSSRQLPAMDGSEGETPHLQEIMDYCLPDRDNVMFRYCLKTTKDLPVSLQLSTSKHDAYCKLQILDHEVPIKEVEGRRCCIIPLHSLQASEGGEENPHKYIVQAVVLRDSWPIPESAWPYISVIRSAEKLDERPDTKPGSAKKARSKGAASKKGSTPQTSTAQMNQQVDTNKPHWTLRIVSNASDKGHIGVTKDTERLDALHSMVQAWETEQPGRSKKALESRRKFLESRAIKDEDGDQSLVGSAVSEGSGLSQTPTGPVRIWQMDLTPFIVKEGSPHLLDQSEQDLRLEERQRMFKDYRAHRQAVLQQRNTDREVRNEAKVKQLEMAENWQCDLDQLRNKLNTGREAIREGHLKKERAKIEAEQVTLEEPAPPPSGRDSKAGKGKAGKGKKK